MHHIRFDDLKSGGLVLTSGEEWESRSLPANHAILLKLEKPG